MNNFYVKSGVFYYIFNENVVESSYQCVNFKSQLSIHNFSFNYKINGLLIQNLITDKHYRNQGYATKLLDYVIKRYSNKNLYLQVVKNNKQAIRFYENRGYKIVDKTYGTIIFKLN